MKRSVYYPVSMDTAYKDKSNEDCFDMLEPRTANYALPNFQFMINLNQSMYF